MSDKVIKEVDLGEYIITINYDQNGDCTECDEVAWFNPETSKCE